MGQPHPSRSDGSRCQLRQLTSAGLALLAILLLGLVAPGIVPAPRTAEAQTDTRLARVLNKPVPESLDDLRIIERRVRELSQRVLPATVSIQVGSASGSGVIVSKDGYVLTAAHVCGAPGRQVLVTFPDGRHVRGITLGVNARIDSGLVQITEEGEWPYVEMADAFRLKPGAWCLATGHPGGFDPNRPGVVRLGRIIRSDSGVIQTDCTLVGGDSGGPLFDMDGRVIGIHSRIGNPTAANFHVPIDTYHLTWDRLTRGDNWGRPAPGDPYLGVTGGDHPKGCQLTYVMEDAPAHKAGLRAGDVIVRANGKPVEGYAAFVEMIAMLQPGDTLNVQIERGSGTAMVPVVVGARP